MKLSSNYLKEMMKGFD